jgi:predicted CxxxxCH...CXXCH cytochrome family protein
MTENELCEACHSDFVSMGAPSYNGLMTHPIIDSAELNTIILDNPAYDMAGTQNYNAASPYTNSAVLIEGGVSCSSCHGPHFTDSNSSTSDGPGASGGDGFLLRSDRPTSLNTVSYNGVTNRYNTAQLRSNLCQDCHTYKMHGDPAYVAFGGPANPNHNIGCLDCHGGHSYNDNNPSLYVLSDASRDAVPIRFQKNFVSYNSVAYPRITSSDTRGDSGSSRVAWDDDTVGTANGFCEVCHGDVNDPVEPGLAKGVDQHKITGTDECSNCHKHNDDGFAFKLDASAASCGDCHGFPPYLNTRGDRAAWYDSRDGGYAYYNAIGSNYLDSSGHFKDEEKTAHKTHAGRDLESAANTAVLGAEGWYFVGQSGVENCSPCHGPDSGKEAGGHKEDPGPNPNTYRDIDFLTSAIANGFGNILGTAYNADTGDDCTNVYCHSSGAPRTGPTGADGDRNWNAGLTTTPVWVGDGGWPGDGFNSITNSGNGNRCQTCHGNDTDCNICHANTAVDKDTLTANATDHRSASGGQHVNGVQNVSYNTTIYNAALLGETYDPKGDGTCSVYCHDVPDPVNTTGKGRTADWDVAVPMTCNSCHDDQTTTFSIGHQEHTDPVGNGPRIGCDDCHGADSDTGIHAGHIDGVVTYITIPDEGTWGSEYPQNFCNKCHGFDAEVGEVEPLWGEDLSLDPGKYCATCHAGAACGASFNNSSNGKPLDATLLSAARTGGHNRPTASNPYPISGNDAANLGCNACHVTTADSPNHFDGDNYENTDLEADLLLRNGGDDNFVAYLGAEDDFCNNCHGSTPLSSNKASTKTQGIVTHSGKLCVACHTVHGDPVNDNIQMIWSDRLKQNQHDPSGTGMFGASNVFFITNNVAVLGAGSVVLGEGSFDEDDNSDGGISEDNADDLCAVCHIDAGIGHNRRDNVDNQAPAGHNMGTNCTSSCHSAHNDPTEAFVVASGDSCDDCHGYPPSTTSPNGASTSAKVGAHGNGTTIKLHTNVGAIVDVDRLTEDRSDCAWCHTGADEYTYSISDDQAAGGARGNHGLSDANQLAVLADVVNSVGFNSADGSCSNACHKSDAADGFWTDTNFDGNAPAQPGLNCDACHFYSGSVSSGDTPTTGVLATQEHDKHFDKNIQCDICHDVENGGLPVAGGLSHIGSFDFGSGADGNDGDALLDMATTEENESDASAWGVNGTDMVFNDTDNTCRYARLG